MNMNQVRKLAKEKKVQTPKGMKKADIIRSIQRMENNYDCFGTDRVEDCNEKKCLWREDCLIEYNKIYNMSNQ